jgi:hypothetical protein
MNGVEQYSVSVASPYVVDGNSAASLLLGKFGTEYFY